MCTRVAYTPNKHQTLTGRNMDWYEPPKPALWAYPAGVKRSSEVTMNNENVFEWTSLYSSVTTANYDCSTSDGINDQGIAVNILWLAMSEYPEPSSHSCRYGMSIGIWAQYILDICATVEDAIAAMTTINIHTTVIPNTQRTATCHLSVSDQEGNLVMFEYIDGELSVNTNIDKPELQARFTHYAVYSKDDMRVMTNAPSFDQQIASKAYWYQCNTFSTQGEAPITLPGSSLATDRFIRASCYTARLPTHITATSALARLASILRNTAKPLGKSNGSGSARDSETQYMSLADQTALHYFYQSAYSPFLMWVNLTDLDFSQLTDIQSQALTLTLNPDGVYEGSTGRNESANGHVANGNVTSHFSVATPFTFLSIKA